MGHYGKSEPEEQSQQRYGLSSEEGGQYRDTHEGKNPPLSYKNADGAIAELDESIFDEREDEEITPETIEATETEDTPELETEPDEGPVILFNTNTEDIKQGLKFDKSRNGYTLNREDILNAGFDEEDIDALALGDISPEEFLYGYFEMTNPNITPGRLFGVRLLSDNDDQPTVEEIEAAEETREKSDHVLDEVEIDELNGLGVDAYEGESIEPSEQEDIDLEELADFADNFENKKRKGDDFLDTDDELDELDGLGFLDIDDDDDWN